MLPFVYEVFSAVLSEGSFHRAALKLNVTPSAISHSINQLENELGFPVFHRARSGVSLTNDGERILPLVQTILNSEAQLVQEAANIKGLTTGAIRIGAFSSVCINWLPPIIRSFHKEYPKIDISVAQGSFNQIVQEVKNGTLDIGLVALPISESLLVTELVKDEIYCVAPREFTPKNGHAVTQKDMAAKSFILQAGDYDRDTKAALDHYDIHPNAIQFSIDDQSIIAMVEAGLGFGILPQLALEKMTGDVAIYPFDKSFFRSVGLVTSAVQAKAPSTKRMIEEITAFVGDQYPTGILTKK